MSEKNSFEQIVSDLAPEIPEGYVTVDDESIEEALRYVCMQKNQAIDDQNFESAARWREYEMELLAGQALGGLIRMSESDH